MNSMPNVKRASLFGMCIALCYVLPLVFHALAAGSMPGIVVQLIFVPALVFALEKARVIPARYPKAM